MVGTRPLGRGNTGIGTRVKNTRINRSKNPKCPNCKRTLWLIHWGNEKGEMHCPQSKGGCGYKNIPN